MSADHWCVAFWQQQERIANRAEAEPAATTSTHTQPSQTVAISQHGNSASSRGAPCSAGRLWIPRNKSEFVQRGNITKHSGSVDTAIPLERFVGSLLPFFDCFGTVDGCFSQCIDHPSEPPQHQSPVAAKHACKCKLSVAGSVACAPEPSCDCRSISCTPLNNRRSKSSRIAAHRATAVSCTDHLSDVRLPAAPQSRNQHWQRSRHRYLALEDCSAQRSATVLSALAAAPVGLSTQLPPEPALSHLAVAEIRLSLARALAPGAVVRAGHLWTSLWASAHDAQRTARQQCAYL